MAQLGGLISSAYLFDDFIITNDNGIIDEDENGPFTLPADATIELKSGASTVDLNVLDDDETFDDGFQDDNPGTLNQFLEFDVSATSAEGDLVEVPAGAVLEVEFTLTATPQGGGEAIDLLFVAAGPGENQGDNTFVVATAPLVPGTVYDISFKNDGGGTPYGAIPCFTRGAMILTDRGLLPIEQIEVGTRVNTLDNGFQTVRWIGARWVDGVGNLRPVIIGAGVLGANDELTVSPNHRVLVSGARCDILFGARDCLVAAKFLLDGDRVRRAAPGPVQYFHMLFDRHEIVSSNGAWTESLHPGSVTLDAIGEASRTEILALFPELETNPAAHGSLARPALRAYEARLLQHQVTASNHTT